ncbi:probable AMP deaminase isoform X2 [Diospyros lotus]|uniref:probable AMP deaminase isoform X2 n=1 Tax=Diospyros lotus TaxID=55363 RepID=UPI00225228C7|nr:probable AMP deaminase isoform X2 [Diospyros lotus]
MHFSSPSPTASFASLALAALFGASVTAISAFYIHKRTVDQVLDRLINLRQRYLHSAAASASADDHSLHSHDDGGGGGYLESNGEIDIDWSKLRYGHANENVLSAYRVSSSSPNVGLPNEWVDAAGGNRAPSASCDDLNLISSDLPPIHTVPKDAQDQSVNNPGSKFWVGSGGRLMTPRSSGGYAFESSVDSDEEGPELATQDDILFTYKNINFSAEYTNLIDNSSNIQTSSTPLFKVDNRSSILDKECRSIPNDLKENIDQYGDGKAETASMNISGNDPIFVNNSFHLTTTMNESIYKEEEEVWKMMICECLALRDRYLYREKVAPWMKLTVGESCSSRTKSDPLCFVPVEATSHYFRMEDGVVHVYASENDSTDLFPVASSTEFFTDMHYLLKVMSIGNARTACHHRLRFLEERFRLHLLVNADKEFLAQKSAPHRDFYNIRKVDTHVHHSACMNQKHLLRFIKSKLRKEPDEVVIFRDGIYLTLKEVFESLQLTGYDLNVDLLDVHADKSTFHRFDKFNLKYNPCGQSRLREIFLKQDNLIQGRFIAEVTKEVLLDLEASKYQMAEYRVSIYGRKQSEWDQLASWFVNNALYSKNAVWLIQLPRLYNVYKGMGTVTSFQNILDNMFIPLFEVTVNPNSHPHLHLFLMQVVGFDLVDDESKPERRPTKHMTKPSEWTNEFNPAYSYYAYYCYANLYTLNKLRESKGMPTIRLRPHCGEAGDIDHLAAAFLLCHNISHGINLRKSPVLQYLYYLAQIGLAMSPLSNNSLFLDYHRNPFPMFFQRGLNVSLSSDDPLQIHLTKEPLVEEYSIAAKVWKLTSCDLCEIARNSVYQSGFLHQAKMHWLGGKYFRRGAEGNDIDKTNVPDMRISFRHETWKAEMQYVYSGKALLPEEIDF